MASVAHTRLKNMPIFTRFGLIHLDSRGIAEVDDSVARQLIELYGNAFHLVHTPSSVPAATPLKTETVEKQPVSSTTDDAPEPKKVFKNEKPKQEKIEKKPKKSRLLMANKKTKKES